MFSRLFASKPAPMADVPPRTPSPDGTIVDNRTSLSPQSKPSKPFDRIRSPSPASRSNAEAIELLKSVPPKALHDFVLGRLAHPFLTDEERRAISDFFVRPSSAGLLPLAPPPRLHCARCHQSYFEVDNGPRSCVMDHDDDSAVVAHTGRTKGGAQYETTWGCCGQRVDGNGDEPPSGFCFIGTHCSDRAFAKYREDADDENDRLDSCEKRKCFQKKRGHKRTATEGRSSISSSASGRPALSDVGVNGSQQEGETEPPRKTKKRKVA